MDDPIEVPEEYTLDDLFEEPPSVTVKTRKGDKTFWIRTPTEPEKFMSQNVAGKKARELRDLLMDEKTEEHQLLVKTGLEIMTPEEMKLIWITSSLFQKTFELNRRSLDDRDEYFVPRPEGKDNGVIPPTQAEMDGYEKARIDEERKRLLDLQAQQTAIYNDLKQKADQIEESQLAETIEPLIVDQKSREEWNNQYGMQILVRCTFLDSDLAHRAFKDTAQAMKLMNTISGQKVMDALLNAHRGLMLDPDEIKN